MNERIKELAEQAREKKFDYRAREGESHYIYVLNEEKFAELIINECLEVVEKQLGGGNGDGVEWDRAIDFTYEDMKKHFGVEL